VAARKQARRDQPDQRLPAMHPWSPSGGLQAATNRAGSGGPAYQTRNGNAPPLPQSSNPRTRPARLAPTTGREGHHRAVPVGPARLACAVRFADWCRRDRPVLGLPPFRRADLPAGHPADSPREPVRQPPTSRVPPRRATPTSGRPGARTSRDWCPASPKHPSASPGAAAGQRCSSARARQARRLSGLPPPVEPVVRPAAGRAARCPSGPGTGGAEQPDQDLAGPAQDRAGLPDQLRARTLLPGPARCLRLRASQLLPTRRWRGHSWCSRRPSEHGGGGARAPASRRAQPALPPGCCWAPRACVMPARPRPARVGLVQFRLPGPSRCLQTGLSSEPDRPRPGTGSSRSRRR
jgi:hypothetical protein